MLVELRIENFAIIDTLEMHFAPGLIAFTGETGAGKSIIIDALETLLGERVDATLVRAGSERAQIEGGFRIPASSKDAILEILEREELLDDPQFITLGREVRANGRSVARVNGRSVGVGLLRELGEYLVDVHGQSEHLSLLRVNQHLNLLDNYLVTSQGEAAQAQISNYRKIYQAAQAARRELQTLRETEKDAARRSDLLNYQISEIEAARLHSGEEETLREERNRLANAEGLASLAQEGLQILDESANDSPTATDLFGQVARSVNGLARLDPSQSELAERTNAIADNISELVTTLRNYLEGIEFNPRRLDQVEERLGLIHGLKRKYGESIAAILAFSDAAKEQLETISSASERIAELEAGQAALLEQLRAVGQVLSETRHAAGEELQAAMEGELNDLNMSGAHFKVDFHMAEDPGGLQLEDGRRVAYYPTGLEKVEFLIAPNPGEGFKPLVKIASGGETSRLMLALKNVLAKADHIPTLVFDEIDQGIGGRVGTIVGEKLRSLARQHQVFCITHLPQLAAFSEQHFHVEKDIQAGRTTTQISELDGEARLIELAQMLGNVSEGTLQSARELIQLAEKHSESI